ncbi:MAG TPA: nucleotidyltransferase domain-containing protein [Chloroflexota bacterium]|nr:nucleotidyltransferase domain-containing protein [Chloroflexota bacterium]
MQSEENSSSKLLTSNPTVDPILNEIVHRIVAAVHPDALYLFGSRARGDATEESDYDILLVVPNQPEQLRPIQHRAYLSLSGLGIAVDVVVMNRESFNRRRRAFSSLPATVEQEGRLLYAA